ncbi:MAG: hypothetical protein WCG42_05745 [Parachlamydiaceae bacterium]
MKKEITKHREELEDPDRKSKALNSIVREVLLYLLPGGANELPLRPSWLRNKVWSFLEEKIQLFVIDQVDPLIKKYQEEQKKVESDQSDLSQFLGEKGKETFFGKEGICSWITDLIGTEAVDLISSISVTEQSNQTETKEDAHQLIEGPLTFLFSRIVLNIGRSLRDEGKESSFPSIIKFLKDELKQPLQDSKDRIAEIKQNVEREIAGAEGLGDEWQIRKIKIGEAEALREAGKPVITNLLSLVFPKGSAELPFTEDINEKIWSLLTDKLAEIYSEKVAPEVDSLITRYREQEKGVADYQSDLSKFLGEKGKTALFGEGGMCSWIADLIGAQAVDSLAAIGVVKQNNQDELKQDVDQLLQHPVTFLVSKLIVNIGRTLQKEQKEVSFSTILKSLTEGLRQPLLESKDRIAEAEKNIAKKRLKIQRIRDSGERDDKLEKLETRREKVLKKASEPIVNHLLNLVFPDGSAELPFTKDSNEKAWSLLEDNLAQLYSEKLAPEIDSLMEKYQDQRKEVEGYQSDLIEFLGTKGKEELFDDKGICSWIIDAIETKAVDSLASIGLVELEEDLGWLLQHPLRFLASRLVVNSGRSLRDRGEEVSFSAIVKSVVDGVKQPLQVSKEYIEEVELVDNVIAMAQEIEDESRREDVLREARTQKIEAQRAASEPVVAYLLNLMFPGGTVELPFTEKTNEKVWLLLKDKLTEACAENIVPLYQEYATPERVLAGYQTELEGLLSDQGAAKFVKNICGIIADKVVTMVKSIEFPVNSEEDSHVSAGSSILRGIAENPEVFNYTKTLIESVLVQGVVHYLQAIKASGTSLNEVDFSSLLRNVVSSVRGDLEKNALAIKEAAAEKDVQKRKEELRKIFLPFSTSLLDQIKHPTLKAEGRAPLDIPFAEFLGEHWENVKENILPGVLSEIYLDTTSWARQIEVSQEAIKQRTQSNYIPEMCRVLGRWVADFLPAFAQRDSETLAKDIYEAIEKSLKQSNTDQVVSVKEYLDKNGSKLQERVCENIFSFFSPDGAFSPIQDIPLDKYVEAALLKITDGLTRKIEETQSQKDFLLKIMVKVLKVVDEHFEVINATVKDQKTKVVSNDLHVDFIKKFGTKLHPNVPHQIDENAISLRKEIRSLLNTLKKERARYDKLPAGAKKNWCASNIKQAQEKLIAAKNRQDAERMGFFNKLTETLLEIGGIKDEKDLPFPAPLRAVIWDQIKNNFLPKVFNDLYALLLDPPTRDAMLISGLTQLIDSLNEPTTENEPDPFPLDEEQKKINKACGKALMSLLGIVPQAVTRAVLKIPMLQAMTSEFLGQKVRRTLLKEIKKIGSEIDPGQPIAETELTLLDLLDIGVGAGIPKLLKKNVGPKDWNGEGLNAQLPEDVKFSFPLSFDAQEAQIRQEQREAEAQEKEMKKLMVQAGVLTASKTMSSVLEYPLRKLGDIWDNAIDKVFGEGCSVDVREFLDALGKKMIFHLIEVVLEFISLPFRDAAKFFLGLYIEFKIKDLPQALHLDIHENLFYKITDIVIAGLNGELKGDDFDAIDEVQKKMDEEIERQEKEDIESVEILRREAQVRSERRKSRKEKK